MDKSVLVIDTPTYCGLCPCFTGERCDVTNKKAYYDFDERPDWCPLRPLPEKLIPEMVMGNEYAIGCANGRNDCIDEITGKTE